MGTRKVLFVDRDGTLIVEPADHQIDSLEKFALVPEVIPALLRLRDAGYTFVVVTNQDGLGTAKYPQAAYDLVQAKLLEVFTSQGITFAETLICPHFPADQCTCRKPHLGLVRAWLSSGQIDPAHSAVVGDRLTDLELAKNMGLRGFRVGPDGERWSAVAQALLSTPRRAVKDRKTKETTVHVEVDLDGEPGGTVHTGLAFFDHMLEQLAKHGGFAMKLGVQGDLAVEAHHTVEDTALTVGDCLKQALGDKVGISRYGFLLPMDEAEAKVSVDLSGRALLVFEGTFNRPDLNGFPTEMVEHFFRSLADGLGATLHVAVRGQNAHHMIEACFKGVGRALRQAIARSGTGELPSTKGVL
ncbi:MAG: bifunctional histidinol-phosphatase/imidazoleglycerol-phosphate dehydratase HisB [Myxococcaceae bacterium]|nr:bifunctional histidinol-phosphatase/imidazoleglycerol-phosphate dehydratase HisB [Myxococcaceae bacterium]